METYFQQSGFAELVYSSDNFWLTFSLDRGQVWVEIGGNGATPRTRPTSLRGDFLWIGFVFDYLGIATSNAWGVDVEADLRAYAELVDRNFEGLVKLYPDYTTGTESNKRITELLGKQADLKRKMLRAKRFAE